MLNENNKAPEIGLAISIYADDKNSIMQISRRLLEIGIIASDPVELKGGNSYRIDWITSGYTESLYLCKRLDGFLTADNYILDSVGKIVRDYPAKIVMDISIYEYGILPAIEIYPDTLRKLARLGAVVSIDIN